MSKFGKWVGTGHHGLCSVLVSRMLRHIRDFHPVKGMDHDGESSECESTVEDEDNKSSEPGIIVECKDSTQTPTDMTDNDDPLDSDEEIPLSD